MKGILPSLLCGAVAGIALFGILVAIEPPGLPEADFWRVDWEKAGLDTHFRSVTPGDESGPLLRRLGDIFEDPGYDGTTVRRYDVNMIRTEIIRLPDERLLTELPEGRHMKFKLGDDRRQAHLCRSGRYIALVAMDVRMFSKRFPSSPKTTEKIFDVFEKTARRLSGRSE